MKVGTRSGSARGFGTRRLSCGLLGLALWGCGEATPTPGAPGPGAGAVDPGTSAPEATAPAEAEPIPEAPPVAVEAAPPPDPDRTVPRPAPQALGERSVVAEPCTLDGAPIVGDAELSTIGPLAWSGEALYLVDAEGAVRRYTRAGTEGCALTLDVGFGAGGALRTGEGPASRPRALGIDGSGTLHVASGAGVVRAAADGTLRAGCGDATSALAIDAGGERGLSVFGPGPIVALAFGEDGCTTSAWPAAPWGTPYGVRAVRALCSVAPTTVLVAGTRDTDAPLRAQLFSLDGEAASAAFGHRRGDPAAPDHLCSVHGAAMLDGSLALLDGNCRRLRFFSMDGEEPAPLGAIDLAALFGLDYPWAGALALGPDGALYVTASQARAGGGAQDGLLFRVHVDD